MALPDTLQIDQALFGYSDGHRQLASSILLPSKDTYELATRSDLSPGASPSGSRSYVSGFELSETRLYALIRTWPAPEMPRPGCVWSHVLLLPRSILTTQIDLGVLESLFRRPGGRGDYEGYKQELKVRRLAKSPPSSPGIVAVIISAYYQNEPVLLDETPDEAFERALFDVWSQQWPRLRSEFSFRTVQSTDPIREKGLAIKVASSSAAGIVQRPEPEMLPWVAAAAEDATAITITPLRRFLWRYGKDVGAPRRSFRQLVEIHALARSRRTGASLAKRVLKSFPKPSDALTLKRDLLGVSPPVLALIPKVMPADLIALLSTWKVVDDGVLAADELRNVVAAYDQDDLISMASGLPALDGRPVREVEIAIGAMVGALNVSVFESAGLPAPVVLSVLRRRPEWLETFDLAVVGALDAIALLDVAQGPSAIANVISRILRETPTDAARTAVERHPMAAFDQAIRRASADLLHPDWMRVFKRLAKSILPDGLRLLIGGSRRAALGLRVLDFPLQASPPAADWFDVLCDPSDGDVTPDRSTIDAFLVALCLRDGVGATVPILVKTLPRLRNMAVNGALSAEAQKLLDAHLPLVSDGWDFNKRLLKVLRKANRDGMGIEPVVTQMTLTSEEVDYIYDEDNENNHSFSFTRFMWPWS